MTRLRKFLCWLGFHSYAWRPSSKQWCDHYVCRRCGKSDLRDNARTLNCDHDYSGRACSKCGKPLTLEQTPRWPF